MRNKLVFENERDHIVKTAHAAILDDRVWDKAMRQNTLNSQVIHGSPQISLNDILQHHTGMYCIVDASWKSPVEKAGIGWSLFSQEGTLRLQGSSAIDPSTSPFIAEAMALLLAVQQLHALGYKEVILLGDCMELFKNLDSSVRQGMSNTKQVSEANFNIQDILYLANKSVFTFHYIPRSLSQVDDVLARKARLIIKIM